MFLRGAVAVVVEPVVGVEVALRLLRLVIRGIPRSGIGADIRREIRTGGLVLDHALLPESIAAVAGAFRANPGGATFRPNTVRLPAAPHCPHGCPQL
ncbi:hypothetical protein [Kribbella antiqua]|uniref:hypothetical protein n=1 Tax=Kribbella antiqua TaxID=2512217 RepID=UPI00104BBE21|nr:hypothetical protein [Kribbella antiqua]